MHNIALYSLFLYLATATYFKFFLLYWYRATFVLLAALIEAAAHPVVLAEDDSGRHKNGVSPSSSGLEDK